MKLLTLNFFIQHSFWLSQKAICGKIINAQSQVISVMSWCCYIAFLCEAKSFANVSYSSGILYKNFTFKQTLGRKEYYDTEVKQLKVTQQASEVSGHPVSSPGPELHSGFPKISQSDINGSITKEKN